MQGGCLTATSLGSLIREPLYPPEEVAAVVVVAEDEAEVVAEAVLAELYYKGC